MAIIKKQKVEKFVTVPIRFEEGLAALLSRYAISVNRTRHYVVSAALSYAIGKDEEFMQQHAPGKPVPERAARRAVAAE